MDEATRKRVLAQVDRDFGNSLDRLRALLRIPSIGTDPAHDADTRRAAEWLVRSLIECGFEARLHETPGHPIVVGHFRTNGSEQRPRLLYYGHYDVQPPDPLELWESAPFDPVIGDGPTGKRIVARGAVDDKGQLMTYLEAFRAVREVSGRLPLPITVVLEGEEESSSTNLEPFLESHKAELAADVCIVSDTSMPGPDRPAITTMLRGIVYAEVTLHGPSHDLHSGMYGGAVVNPINALVRLLAGLHDEHGRVRLDGFYDQVRELEPGELEAWMAAGIDEQGFLATAGLDVGGGEEGRSTLERVWSRPALDINGIWGGYTGQGSKTVIPACASAKLSCRLVPDQDPDAVFASLERCFRHHCPDGCRITLSDLGRGSPIRVPSDTPVIGAAERAAARVFPKPPVRIGCGGSIPVVAALKRILGLDTLLLGFGLDDDRVHSPNEKFDLRCFERGIKTHACLLAELARRVP